MTPEVELFHRREQFRRCTSAVFAVIYERVPVEHKPHVSQVSQAFQRYGCDRLERGTPLKDILEDLQRTEILRFYPEEKLKGFRIGPDRARDWRLALKQLFRPDHIAELLRQRQQELSVDWRYREPEDDKYGQARYSIGLADVARLDAVEAELQRVRDKLAAEAATVGLPQRASELSTKLFNFIRENVKVVRRKTELATVRSLSDAEHKAILSQLADVLISAWRLRDEAVMICGRDFLDATDSTPA